MKVSRLCLGARTAGGGSRKWRPWVLSEEEARPFIRRAIDLGINFFDTADMYSVGESRRSASGQALKEFGLGRDRMIVATKVFYPMGDDPNGRGLSRKLISSPQSTPACAVSGPTTWISTKSTVSITRRRSTDVLAALHDLVQRRQGTVHRRVGHVRLGSS